MELNDQDWNLLIQQYLHKKGFKEAEKAFAEESGGSAAAHKDEMSLHHRLETHKGVVENLLTQYSTRDDPNFASAAFDKLVQWVDNSLDVYRVRRRWLMRRAVITLPCMACCPPPCQSPDAGLPRTFL